MSIPVGFHGHNNLGLSVANALAAIKGGAEVLDCGLMGMARSAGNCPTELIMATLQKLGQLEYVNFYTLIHFIDDELAPAMREYGYRIPVEPIDLIYGFAGCHSSFAKLFAEVAAERKVDLFKLIVEVSKIDKKAPSIELVEKVASTL